MGSGSSSFSLETKHQPVLLRETLEALSVGPNDDVLDATVGGGGHARSILEATAPNGRLLGLDRDPDAIQRAGSTLRPYGSRAVLVRANLKDLGSVARTHAFAPMAVLLDLGVSMDQLRDVRRGFTFEAEAPLDMRMDPDQPLTAGLIVSRWKPETLTALFQDFDEPLARPVAEAIAHERTKRSLATTTELADLVSAVSRRHFRSRSRRHPATRVFLALRSAVNDERGELEAGLPQALDLLPPGGRLAVITFHSAEDRLVKNIFRTWAIGCTAKTHEPGCDAPHHPRVRIPQRHPSTASRAEVTTSPASRSARLRWAVKLPSVIP